MVKKKLMIEERHDGEERFTQRIMWITSANQTHKHKKILTAVIRIRNTHSTADDASSLEGSVIALVAGMHDGHGVYETVADDTLSVALFA